MPDETIVPAADESAAPEATADRVAAAILDLQNKNSELEKENAELRRRAADLDKVLAGVLGTTKTTSAESHSITFFKSLGMKVR